MAKDRSNIDVHHEEIVRKWSLLDADLNLTRVIFYADRYISV